MDLNSCAEKGDENGRAMSEKLNTPLLTATSDRTPPPSPKASAYSPSKSRLASFFRFCRAHFNDFSVVSGPLVFALLLVFLEVEDETGKSADMVAAMCWVFLWWVTEAVPLAITALVPLFLLPFLEIETASKVSKSYVNDTVFLILGSFILAAAVRYHNLHKRMAIRTVLLFGRDPRLLLFGFCIGSAFISMFVDNAAAASMLMPMAVGVMQKVHTGFHPEDSLTPRGRMRERRPDLVELMARSPEKALKVELDYCRGVVICIALSVTLGGMSTLTGNAVNLVFAGIWETDYPNENPISYFQWMLFAFPFAFVMLIILWILICLFFCPPSAVRPISASLHSANIEDELALLGPMTCDQIVIVILYFILVVLWTTRTFTGEDSGWASLFDEHPGNGSVTILMAVSLFVIPNPVNPKQKLMNWSQCKDIPWNVILLVGGGFALAGGISASGLSDVISREMNFLESTPNWAITPVITVVTGVLTEFTSNSAIASIFLPLAAEIAQSINKHPLFLMVPVALGSQLSFMLPIATGPNAIAYSTDTLRVKDMSAPGIILKIFGILFLSILMPTLGVVVFKTDTTVDT